MVLMALRRAGATALVVAMVTTGAASPALAQASSASAARSALQKLTANDAFPYTQLDIRLPRVSGPGVTAREATLVTGLELVVATEQAAKQGQPAASELSVYYRGTELGELRALGGNLYVLLDVAHWAALPVQWGASAKKELSAVDLALGERWFELSGAMLKGLGAKLKGLGARGATSSVPSALGQVGLSPAALRNLVLTAVTKLADGMGWAEAPSAGGNLAFSAHGTLKSLAGEALSVSKALHLSTGQPQASSVPQGTYSVLMTTADAGRYIGHVDIGLEAVARGSLSLSLAFAHATEPVAAPQGAKLVTPQMLSGMGL